MEYYIGLVLVFILGYLITEAITRAVYKRKINVTIKHHDGSISIVSVNVGRDTEIDKFISEAKQNRKREA
jgi:hypothetical protein